MGFELGFVCVKNNNITFSKLFICRNPAERFRRRRSSVDLTMSIYPGDLLVQEHHKKLLLKRNTIADFAAVRHGSTVSVHEGNKYNHKKYNISTGEIH